METNFENVSKIVDEYEKKHRPLMNPILRRTFINSLKWVKKEFNLGNTLCEKDFLEMDLRFYELKKNGYIMPKYSPSTVTTFCNKAITILETIYGFQFTKTRTFKQKREKEIKD